MDKMIATRKIYILLLAVVLMGCCIPFVVYAANDDKPSGATEQYIPKAPDYNDKTMWITVDGDPQGTGADVFYVVSTWEEEWTTEDGHICHYADVWNPAHREHMGDWEINKVAAYMSPGNRFFAPFYRHTTIEAFMLGNEDSTKARARLAMDDVCKAFDHFQAHRDKTRPLIIAGFSQGGLAVVELLKHMDDETYSQLAAAYVLGYKVTPDDTLQTKHIKAAQGADDTGVTICYNTVKDLKYINPVIAATCMGINPVNWRTDTTPATLHDTITVRLSPEYHVLVVSGYSGSEYPAYKDFINVGDIHSCEPWLYSECLAKNISVRAEAWRKHHQPQTEELDLQRIILIYLAVITVMTFLMFGVDKWKARRDKWRIRETSLLLLALLGGSLGAWIGMKVWHHKTKHKKFKYCIPLILVVHLVLLAVVAYYQLS